MTKWEHVTTQDELETSRLKVIGGYLYQNIVQWRTDVGMTVFCNMCFVPDDSMQVFGHHIKQAYNDGYEKGKSENDR